MKIAFTIHFPFISSETKKRQLFLGLRQWSIAIGHFKHYMKMVSRVTSLSCCFLQVLTAMLDIYMHIAAKYCDH